MLKQHTESREQVRIMATDNVDRFHQFYDDLNIPNVIANRQLFFKHGPLAMAAFFNPLVPSTVTESDCHSVRQSLGILGVIEFNAAPPSGGNWYYLHRAEPIDLEKIPAKKRYDIRKGLTHCTVEKLSVSDFLSRDGLSVAARCSRKRKTSFSKKDFLNTLQVYVNFPDEVHIWGVFFECKMAGFSINYILPDTQCYFNQIDLCPLYLDKQSSYALVYVMSNAYLCQGYTINAGFKRIYHPTEFQEYLVSKFGFEKKPLLMTFSPNKALRFFSPLVLKIRDIFHLTNGRVAGLAVLFDAMESRWR